MALPFGLIKQQQNGTLNTFCIPGPSSPRLKPLLCSSAQSLCFDPRPEGGPASPLRPPFPSVSPVCSDPHPGPGDQPHLNTRLSPVASLPSTPFPFFLHICGCHFPYLTCPPSSTGLRGQPSLPEGRICTGCSTRQGACG